MNEQLAKQRSYQTLYEDERNKNAELEDLLEMQGSLDNATKISCTVLQRSANSWDQTVTISAGSSQGVENNMLVVTSQGAVGLIESTQTATSTVRLLTSEDLINDIAIMISMEDGSNVEGVLQSYDADRNAYRVSLFDNNAQISTGQMVATSGKEEIIQVAYILERLQMLRSMMMLSFQQCMYSLYPTYSHLTIVWSLEVGS